MPPLGSSENGGRRSAGHFADIPPTYGARGRLAEDPMYAANGRDEDKAESNETPIYDPWKMKSPPRR